MTTATTSVTTSTATHQLAAEQDVLHAAAAVIRDRASAAIRGPWVPYTTNIDHDTGSTISRPYCSNDTGDCDPDCGEMVLRTGAEDCDDDFLSRADASYIAALHPGVGHAVADLLDTTAGTTDLPSRWQALAVARALR